MVNIIDSVKRDTVKRNLVGQSLTEDGKTAHNITLTGISTMIADDKELISIANKVYGLQKYSIDKYKETVATQLYAESHQVEEEG